MHGLRFFSLVARTWHGACFAYWQAGTIPRLNQTNQQKPMNTELYNKIEKLKRASAWKRGVKEYALEMIESAEIELTLENAKQTLLNGAKDWSQYSFGGCALIYDADIAERLCSPSELKRKKGGDLQPNSRESWLDVQTRALKQACNLIKSQFLHNLES